MYLTPFTFACGFVFLCLLLGKAVRGSAPTWAVPISLLPSAIIGGLIAFTLRMILMHTADRNATIGFSSTKGQVGQDLSCACFAAVALAFGSPTTRAFRRATRARATGGGGGYDACTPSLPLSCLPATLGGGRNKVSIRWRVRRWLSRVLHEAAPQVFFGEFLAWSQLAVAMLAVHAMTMTSVGNDDDDGLPDIKLRSLGVIVSVGLEMSPYDLTLKGLQSLGGGKNASSMDQARDYATEADTLGMIFAFSFLAVVLYCHPPSLGGGRQRGGTINDMELFQRGAVVSSSPAVLVPDMTVNGTGEDEVVVFSSVVSSQPVGYGKPTDESLHRLDNLCSVIASGGGDNNSPMAVTSTTMASRHPRRRRRDDDDEEEEERESSESITTTSSTTESDDRQRLYSTNCSTASSHDSGGIFFGVSARHLSDGDAGGSTLRRRRARSGKAPSSAWSWVDGGDAASHPPSEASLGAHIALVATCLLAAAAGGWVVHLCLPSGDGGGWVVPGDPSNVGVAAGLRLFPAAALFGILLAHSTASFGFRLRRTWLHRLSGIFVDALTVAAISLFSLPVAAHGGGGGGLGGAAGAAIWVAAVACAAWTAGACVYLCPLLTPNFHAQRAAAEATSCLGNAWLGLLVVRAMDPLQTTAVPVSFVFRQLVGVLLIGSGPRHSLALYLVDTKGLHVCLAAGICLAIALLWAAVPLFAYRRRWRRQQPAVSSKGDPESSRESSTVARAFDVRDGRPSAELESLLLPPTGATGGAELSDSAQAQPRASPPASSAVLRLRLSVSGRPASSAILNRCRGGEDPAGVFSGDFAKALIDALPLCQRDRSWQKLFDISQDGASLLSLYEKTSKAPVPQLLLIEDSWGYVFGACLSEPLKHSGGNYYGTGSGFVFTLRPRLAVYPWSGMNDMFQFGTKQSLGIGGGGDGFAIFLDDELENGSSADGCETFNSPGLASSNFFRCVALEVYGVGSP